ncbi:Hypp521 [Branchiostoma lanceolatum]|uniref:Hypp521 protein n=1 Tax=Branchiostoma lanceolatum TaxID=7740 RepID=A0A8J9W4I9_BRALA|nr:Hypp521 [Branchiostoma lanceolatum]
MRRFTRTIVRQAANGGRECGGYSSEDRPCNRFCSNGDCSCSTCCSTTNDSENGGDSSLELMKILIPSILSSVTVIVVAILVVCWKRPNNAVANSSTTTAVEDMGMVGSIVGLAPQKNEGAPPAYTPRASPGMPSVSM